MSTAISLGALMGARGNSGVILSQIVRGLGDSMSGAHRVAGAELAAGLARGCDAAYAAVSQPVEGTILTVVRDAARAAHEALPANGTLEHVLAAASDEAAASVERTPQLLPVLRHAGVVDAGGRGLELVLRGALAAVRGEHIPHIARLPHDVALPHVDGIEVGGYGYETVFVVTPTAGAQLDVERMRGHLRALGESVLVAGDQRALKIHVHSDHPDKVIAYGLSLGTLTAINIENLDRQVVRGRRGPRRPCRRGCAFRFAHVAYGGDSGFAG